jgi:RNA polymerase sigma factor (sigma-70 family)
LKRPAVILPAIFDCVGFFGMLVSETTPIVDVAFVFHVSVSLPFVGLLAPFASVVQFPGFENFAVSTAVADFTPPPTHPPILPPVAETVERTVLVLVSFGNAGLNVAVPLSVLHFVPPTAPAGEAINPTGSIIAAINTTPATLRILYFPSFVNSCTHLFERATRTHSGAVPEVHLLEVRPTNRCLCHRSYPHKGNLEHASCDWPERSYDCGMRKGGSSQPGATSRDLEDLYRELAPAVLGYLRGSGAAEPEDLLGDVFVAVIRGLPNCGDDPTAIRRWVFTVAHHRLVDERRRRMTRSRDVAFDVQHEPSADDCYDEMLNRLSASPAVRALEALTPDQRSVVLLRDVADLSVADTAAVLGKKSGAVKTTHRRALAALATRVSGEAVR